jgi:hypothetical protein
MRQYFNRDSNNHTHETQIRHINREIDPVQTPFINKQHHQHQQNRVYSMPTNQINNNLPYPTQNNMPQPINNKIINDDLPPPYPSV